MGMGYSASFIVEVKQTDIEKMGLQSYKGFIKILNEENVSIEAFASSVQLDDLIYNKEDHELDKVTMDQLYASYDSFVDAFKEQTGVGISMGWHNSTDNGSSYDEVKDVFFSLDFSDVYQLTTEAAKLKDKVPFDFKSFVTYG